MHSANIQDPPGVDTVLDPDSDGEVVESSDEEFTETLESITKNLEDMNLVAGTWEVEQTKYTTQIISDINTITTSSAIILSTIASQKDTPESTLTALSFKKDYLEIYTLFVEVKSIMEPARKKLKRNASVDSV